MNRRKRSEAGQATIDFIGVLPFAILVAGVIIQIFLVGYAAISAESSARLAAREASQGTSQERAADRAEKSIPSLFEPSVVFSSAVDDSEEPGVSVTSNGDTSTARSQVKVPFLGIGVDKLDITLTRYATMPNTD